jgi:carbonic anhydrase
MSTIDYTYSFDPKNPAAKPTPADAESARRMLEDGNRTFAQWMESCQKGTGQSAYVVPSGGLAVGGAGRAPKQAPFAVVVSCSDARVPTELVFGQGFNDLFVVRVAGNVLGDECLGSIDYAVHALSDSVKVVVVLGHTGCGAVSGAVDAYLDPSKYWSKFTSHTLRAILRRIFTAVREAASGMREAWGPDARQKPGYREALIDVAVAINAAQSAYDLRLDVERAGKTGVQVLHGVYDTATAKVSAPSGPALPHDSAKTQLAYAPTNPRDFHELAVALARASRPA